MRRLVSSIVFALALVLGGAHAYADYWMADADEYFARDDFAIVILQVDRYEAHPKREDWRTAHVEIEAALLNAVDVDTISSVSMSCYGEKGLEIMGVVPGQRYVVLMVGDEMAEEQSYFPIDDAGMVDLRSEFYRDWFGFDSLTVSLGELQTRIDALAR